MRRFVAALSVGVLSFAVVGGPAEARVADALNRNVSGPLTGTSVTSPIPSCGATQTHQVVDATYTTQHGRSGSLHLDGCIGPPDPSGDLIPYAGSFVLTTPTRAVLTGTTTGALGGLTRECEFARSFAFTLALTKGTKAYERARGDIDLIGSFCNPFAGIPFAMGGTLTGHLEHGPSA